MKCYMMMHLNFTLYQSRNNMKKLIIALVIFVVVSFAFDGWINMSDESVYVVINNWNDEHNALIEIEEPGIYFKMPFIITIIEYPTTATFNDLVKEIK